jgi:hypothetical protein
MPFISIGQFLWPKVVSNDVTGVTPGFDFVPWGLKKK